MLRLNSDLWYYGARMVGQTEAILGNHYEEITLLSNFEEGKDIYGVNIEPINEDDPISDNGRYCWRVYVPVDNMLKFIYKVVLKEDKTIEQILADPLFEDNVDIYLHKFW